MRRTSVAVLAAVAAAWPTAGRAAEDVERFVGVARGRDGTVLYREEHVVRRDGDRLVAATTTYRDAAGREIAALRTDFSRDPYAPSYVFEDLRSGVVEAVTPGDGRLELRAGPRSKVLRAPAGEARRLVTGQGLDRYVRARLDDVVAGEQLDLTYPVPGRLDAYAMRIRSLGTPRGGVVRVRAEFASWVLRLLAPSLDVDYDAATRRLLRYRGLSNLDFAGENPEVEITYAYPPVPAAAAEDPRAAL